MVKCRTCHILFQVTTPWNKKTCSKECHYKLLKQNARVQQEKKKSTPVRRKCRWCGKEVISTAYCPQSFCGGKAGECRRAFLSKSRMGKLNPAYRSGFAVQGSRKYTGAHLRACSKYRKDFVEKHGYQFCELCKVNQNGTQKFEVHHIYFASLWPKHPQLHNFLNLINLCIQCHNDMHAGKKNETIFKRLEKKRGLKELFL